MKDFFTRPIAYWELMMYMIFFSLGENIYRDFIRPIVFGY